MLALARVAVSEPSVVLLDEVSTGLTPRLVDDVFERVQSTARAGVAVVLVEQYARRALAIADHVYVLRQGDVVYAGTPVDVESTDLLARYAGV